jgi:pimeloyl-ACP methyl ester carboxylesterase
MMMNLYFFLLQTYYRILSVSWPAKAGEKAFQLFQRTRKLPVKKVEWQFYNQARKFEVVHPRENIHAYESGNPQGKLILLVHGWESNAGSMGAIANALAEEGFRVVALDLPAHGSSTLTHTNLRECREAVRALIYQLRPAEPFSVVAHSFGSAVATYALSGSRYVVDHFIMLTTPNRLIDIFDTFRTRIALGDKAYERMLGHAFTILNEPVREISVEQKALDVNYRKLILIHDVNDKVIPFAWSQRLVHKLPNTELVTLAHTGHYRMLWNPEVINQVREHVTAREVFMPVSSETALRSA